MSDPYAGFEAGPPALQALNNLQSMGAVVTNGRRTDADYFRLKAEGYTPARFGAHPQGNGVDLVPGGKFKSLADLQAAAQQQFGPNAIVQIHNGSHVHVATPDFQGLAPDVTRGADSYSRFEPVAGPSAPQSTATPPGYQPTGQLHDGDTFRLNNGRNARLFGVDAFELNQTGQSPSGSTVPLGLQARNTLAPFATPSGSVTPQGSFTYGRPVVTLNNGGDAGQALARAGLAIPEPKYLQGSPLFSPYMEAGREARMNFLGGYGTNAVAPEQYRHPLDNHQEVAGVYGAPNTQVVFNGTPTPTGLTPEETANYVKFASQPNITPDDLVNYVKGMGYQLTHARAAKFLLQRSQAGGKVAGTVSMEQLPRPVINPGDGAFGVTARGFGDPFNFLPQLGSIPDALGATPGRENIWNSNRSFGDIRANNAAQNEDIIASDQATHPNYRLGGQIAGGLVVPLGGELTVPRLMAIGGTEGALAGYGSGEGGFVQRFPNAAIGAVTGTLTGGALAGAAKAAPGLYRFGRRFLGQDVAPNAGRLASDAALESIPVLNDGIQQAGPTPAARQQPSGGVVAAMAADRGPEIVSPPVRQRDYINTGRDPYAGFQLMPSARDAANIPPEALLQPKTHGIENLDEAAAANPSRFEDVVPTDERQQLNVLTLKHPVTGGKVYHRGPLDLIGYLRASGGLKPTGDLESLGITNKPRLDNLQERNIGPLISKDGMNLDDAGEMLHEAGFFPQGRPTEAEVLDAVSAAHDSGYANSPHFLPEDLPQMQDYHAARYQRYKAEEAAQAGTPLTEDNSQSINLDDLIKRDAPDYAYNEDVPANARLGNINLNNIRNVDDVFNGVRELAARMGEHPEAARAANADTFENARGVKLIELLNRKSGEMWNKEQIGAADLYLKGVLDFAKRAAQRVVSGGTPEDKLKFEKAMQVAGALLHQRQGARAEVARAMQMMGAMAPEGENRAAQISYMFSKRAEAGGRPPEDVAREFIDTMDSNPEKVGDVVRQATEPTMLQKFNEALTMARLSNPETHFRNFLGNAGALVGTFPEKLVEAGIGKLTGSSDRTYLSEVSARARGQLGHLPEAWQNFKQSFRTGDPIDGASKLDAMQYHAISGTKGDVIRLPGRLMTAADELFKGLHYHGDIAAQARHQAIASGLKGAERDALEQQLIRNPTEEMANAANTEARYRTFQQELGKYGKDLQRISNTWPGAKIPLAFVRTPINLVKYAAERTPLGLTMPSVLRKLAAGGQQRDEALARMSLTTLTLAGLGAKAAQGDITGNGPTDPNLRAQMMAQGWRPLSVRVGDHWVSYANYDPFSTVVAATADLAAGSANLTDKQREAAATNITLNALAHFTDNAWFSGVSDFFGAMKDHESAPGYISRTASGIVVPSVVNRASQLIDPTIRDTRINSRGDPNPVTQTGSMTWDAIKAKTPFASRSLPERLDAWGQPMTRDNAVGIDAYTPIKVSPIQRDPVSAEVSRLGVFPSAPDHSFKSDGVQITLAPDEYNAFVQRARIPAKEEIARQMASPSWHYMTDADKRDTIKGILKDAQEAAKEEVLARRGGTSPRPQVRAPVPQSGDPYAMFEPAAPPR